MDGLPDSEARLNCFALVTYIPDPLGRFLDDLRQELVPGCRPRAHVTILPPRPIFSEPEVASEQVGAAAMETEPFEIQCGEVAIFPVTDVVFLELRNGARQLRDLHHQLNSKHLEFREPFPYHPHITLAQDLPPGTVQAVAELADRRWREFRFDRSFPVENLSFVQSTAGNKWIDLAYHPLGAAESLVR
ncbi:MAG: 2'-5' RNA ligase family protein [Bryobacteraceae bacterium]